MDPFNSPQTNTFLDSNFLNPDFLFAKQVIFFQGLFHFFFIGSTFKIILAVLSIFFLSVLAYASVRMLEIRKKESANLARELEEYARHMEEKAKKKREGEGVSKNERWNNILAHLSSNNPGDWRVAIIEADSMLEILMDQLGFKGKSLGDRLKSADRDKFPGLTTAWEVHTIRNRIAHEGISYEISLHEARRVIALYENIFRDFGYI